LKWFPKFRARVNTWLKQGVNAIEAIAHSTGALRRFSFMLQSESNHLNHRGSIDVPK
jgi:hypothetical protein